MICNSNVGDVLLFMFFDCDFGEGWTKICMGAVSSSSKDGGEAPIQPIHVISDEPDLRHGALLEVPKCSDALVILVGLVELRTL